MKKVFIDFLKDLEVYDQYVEAFNPYFAGYKTLDEFFKAERPCNWVLFAFMWHEKKIKPSTWSGVSQKWFELCTLEDSFECPKDTIEGTGMVFNFKANYAGKLFLLMLRKALNNTSYTMRVRGSCADRKGLREQGINVNDDYCPLKYADRYRVYINGIAQDVDKKYWEDRYYDQLAISNTYADRLGRVNEIINEV
jgi:hypothetical protein